MTTGVINKYGFCETAMCISHVVGTPKIGLLAKCLSSAAFALRFCGVAIPLLASFQISPEHDHLMNLHIIYALVKRSYNLKTVCLNGFSTSSH